MNKLIVLDIDETLIHSYEKEVSDFDFKFNSDEDIFYTKKRPFLDEFIEYCFDNFKVAVWTSADRDYASQILKNIGITESDLLFFYSRENCSIKLDHELGIYIDIKPLNKIKDKISLDKVLIIDDKPETARNNYGNLIRIKAFKDDNDDSELLKLISYLEKIKNEPDFRRIEKRGWSQS